MKKKKQIPVCTHEPHANIITDSAFHINFQRAILFSLLQSKKINRMQFDRCVEMVIQKYSVHHS